MKQTVRLQSRCEERGTVAYSFLNLTKFFELLTQCTVVGVPCKATRNTSMLSTVKPDPEDTYPIKSFDMM